MNELNDVNVGVGRETVVDVNGMVTLDGRWMRFRPKLIVVTNLRIIRLAAVVVNCDPAIEVGHGVVTTSQQLYSYAYKGGCSSMS